MYRVVREMTWFDRKDESHVGTVRLRGATLKALQRLFGAPSDDPMYECYPVCAEHLKDLQRWADLRIDLDKYDYFVECSRVESAPVPATTSAQPIRRRRTLANARS
jgi:hypothetical protein